MTKTKLVLLALIIPVVCTTGLVANAVDDVPPPVTSVERAPLTVLESRAEGVSRNSTRDDLAERGAIQAARDDAAYERKQARLREIARLARIEARQEERRAIREAERAEARAAEQAEAQVQTPVMSSGSSDGLNWLALRNCESGNDYQRNTGNGYSGAYQFLDSTWQAMGGTGSAWQAPPAEQDMRARMLLEAYGDEQWPACGDLLYS